MRHTVSRLSLLVLLSCIQVNSLLSFLSFTITNADRECVKDVLNKHIALDTEVVALSFSSDVLLSDQEFSYLFNIDQNNNFSCADCSVGIERLFKKEKFESIICTVTKKSSNQVEIHLALKAMWTFGGLRFRGILVGRERLAQYYMMETGEQFDRSKHEHSLKKIQTMLRYDGYLKAKVASLLVRHDQTKTISVNVKVSKGSCFIVDAVNVNVRAGKKVGSSDCIHLENQLKKRYLARMVGGYYSKQVLDKEATSLKDYLNRNGYPSARIQLEECIDSKKSRVTLNFTIKLCEKRLFNFVGNQFFSRRKLLDQILCFGKSSWLLPVSMLSQEIEQAYHQNGFWNVTVFANEEGQKCEFNIIEGVRFRLVDVELKGVESCDSRCLKEMICDTICTAQYYDEYKLNEAINRLYSYYHKRGYWHMRVLEQKQVVFKDSNEASLLIVIDEGQPVYINSVTLVGVDDVAINTTFNSTQKEICSQENINKQKELIAAECKRLHIDAVRIYPEYTKQADGINLVWHIELENTEEAVGKTILVGSSVFPFEYVLREVRGEQGGVWNQSILHNSLKRIKHLQIFDQASLRPCNFASEDGERDIIVRLHLDDQYEARVRLGAGLINTGKQYRFEDLTYKAGGSLFFKNVSNCADHIKFEADATRTHRVLELGYWRPWIIDMPIEMLAQGYYNRYEYPGLLRGLVDLYSVSQQGFLLGLTRTEEYGALSCNVGIEWMKTTLPDERPCLFDKEISEAINFEPNLVGERVPYLWCEPTFYVEWVDNKLSPHRGFSTLLTMKAMAPVSKTRIASYFVKIMAEQCVYVPFFNSVVLALRMRGGYIFHRCFKNIMPTERFYLGGLHSIRSYDTDLCPPLGKITDECTGKEQLVPQGGKAMVNSSFELRFPVYENFGGVLFQDVGYLSGSGFTDLLHSELLLATGVGVRYNTPISPLRFDLGFKWSKPDESMSRYAWFLSFGHPF